MNLIDKFQMLGYGWAGIFRKILVDSPYMWWPDNMVAVSLFRYLIIISHINSYKLKFAL